MKRFITWVELKTYRQVLLMVALSVVLAAAAWAGETFGMEGNLLGAAGSFTAILWMMFGAFLFLRLLRRKPAPPECGNDGHPRK
jgi:hypothetical protein